ncbi:MAG: TraR/DksA C4-type zinc finger protein [bacterium]
MTEKKTVQEKTRYSDKELQEFKILILEEIVKIQNTLLVLQGSDKNGNGTEDTSPTFQNVEDAKKVSDNTTVNIQVARLLKHLGNLDRALTRIANKTYGICIKSGKLIPKGRLLASLHATTCIEEKQKK